MTVAFWFFEIVFGIARAAMFFAVQMIKAVSK